MVSVGTWYINHPVGLSLVRIVIVDYRHAIVAEGNGSQQPGWWILVTFFVTRPKSSLVLDANDPQSLVNLIAMDISYKKPCQYVRRTLSVTDRNVQKKKCQFFLVSYCGWYVDKLDITSQSRNYPIVILPTTRYKLSACPFSTSSENSECCSVRISGFVRCLVWRTCEQMQHTHIAMYY